MKQADIAALRAVRMEDIPPEQRDLAEALGMEAYLKLVALCGGMDLYLPKLETLKRSGRNRELRARFDGGNSRALAAQFRLSQRQVRKIVNRER